jgi:hypothetical protein
MSMTSESLCEDPALYSPALIVQLMAGQSPLFTSMFMEQLNATSASAPWEARIAVRTVGGKYERRIHDEMSYPNASAPPVLRSQSE